MFTITEISGLVTVAKYNTNPIVGLYLTIDCEIDLTNYLTIDYLCLITLNDLVPSYLGRLKI